MFFIVDHVLIHYEPQKKETSTLAIPLKEDKQSLSEHFGETPCFYLATVRERDGVLLSEAYHGNPFAGEESGFWICSGLLKSMVLC